MTNGVQCSRNVQTDEGCQLLVICRFTEALHNTEKCCFSAVANVVRWLQWVEIARLSRWRRRWAKTNSSIIFKTRSKQKAELIRLSPELLRSGSTIESATHTIRMIKFPFTSHASALHQGPVKSLPQIFQCRHRPRTTQVPNDHRVATGCHWGRTTADLFARCHDIIRDHWRMRQDVGTLIRQ